MHVSDTRAGWQDTVAVFERVAQHTQFFAPLHAVVSDFGASEWAAQVQPAVHGYDVILVPAGSTPDPRAPYVRICALKDGRLEIRCIEHHRRRRPWSCTASAEDASATLVDFLEKLGWIVLDEHWRRRA